MADVFERDRQEAAYARSVAREFGRFRKEIVEIIPELPAGATTIPPALWEKHKDKLLEVLVPLLSATFMTQSETFMDDFAFLGVDFALVNEAAAEWSRRYGFELVSGLNNTSRRSLQRIIPNYFEEEQTIGELNAALTPTFGPKRAEMIAVTEVTRAAAEGERETVGELERQGFKMQPVWQTNEDELVCPICGPRNDKPIQAGNETNGEYPPAHPRCRCWVNHELLSESGQPVTDQEELANG